MSVEELNVESNEEPILEADPPADEGGGLRDPAPETEPVESSYQPNYNYKVLDQEKEFPEYIRAAIRDADTEKEIREIYEKAEGLEHVKERRKFLEDENKQYKEQWGPIVQSAQQLHALKEKEDLETLFEQLGIPEDKIFGYVHNRLQLKEDPRQLEQHTQFRQVQMQNQQLQQQNEYFRQQHEAQVAQQKASELDTHLSDPAVATVIQDFDARLGQSGQFRQEVIDRAAAYERRGEHLTAEQAVQLQLKYIGYQPQATAPAPQVAQTRQRPPTLPNLQGQGSSPAKKMPTSLDALRALGRQKLNQGL